MEQAIFINRATAARIAAALNRLCPHSAVVRPATRRSCLLGYYVAHKGLNLTENALQALKG